MAEGAALASEGGSGGPRGVCKGGLQAALDGARAAHTDKRLTLWFMDETRFGQKGRVCHRWFTRGQRPPGLCDQRYTWTHLFAAVRPATGEDFCLVLPRVCTEAMDRFLLDFAATVPGDTHAIMVLDGAGWHDQRSVTVPPNVTLVPPPFAYPHFSEGFASLAPRAMSVSRERPRHITVFPGGGSLVRAK